ncbi:MAG: hypothetical protein ACP5E3_19155 [Bacteroidales bacterium]
MKTQNILKNITLSALLGVILFLSSCEKHEYCAECWEHGTLFTWGTGDISFCSDDLLLVDEFIYDYEGWGWKCKVRD